MHGFALFCGRFPSCTIVFCRYLPVHSEQSVCFIHWCLSSVVHVLVSAAQTECRCSWQLVGYRLKYLGDDVLHIRSLLESASPGSKTAGKLRDALTELAMEASLLGALIARACKVHFTIQFNALRMAGSALHDRTEDFQPTS